MNWKEFQEETANIFRAAGCKAEIEAKVNGVRGSHKVDVYVTFTKYGIDCSWVIECKNWNSNVPKEKVAALQGIVSDIGADKGVIISKLGFQSGAIKLARSSNITLTSLEDLKDYLEAETTQRELDFLEKQVLHMKHVLFELARKEKTEHGWWEWSYPAEVDGEAVMTLVGKLSIFEMGFDQLKLGNSKLPGKFNEDSGKIQMTKSIDEFLGAVKDIIVECAELIALLKGNQA